MENLFCFNRFRYLSININRIFNNFKNSPLKLLKNNARNNQWNYALAMTFGLSLSLYKKRRNNVQACGIIGMVTDQEEVQSYLMEGLSILQNRGYDSAGVATINWLGDQVLTLEEKMQNLEEFRPCKINVTKYASRGTTSDSLDILQNECPTEHALDHCGIAHTRWATHGAKTDINAHPHCDYDKRIALVHNGTIENCSALKQELMAKGIPFLSQTDTEVIANLVGYYLDTLSPEEVREISNGANDLIESALRKALSRLDGSWGLAMIAESNPDKIYAARNGSPLMIGLDPTQNRNFIASEHLAFARYTNDYIALEDGEVAVISAHDVAISNKNTRIEKTPEMEEILTSPKPYKHWTLKEIMEEPESISRALSYGSRLTYDQGAKLGGLEKETDLLKTIKNLIITGCGTSMYAGIYGKKLMQYLNSFETVSVIDAAELTSDALPRLSAGLLAISQSGETKDVVLALQIAESLGVPRFSIINTVGSLIARLTGLGVYTYSGREHGVASTKAFVGQVTVLALIASWFAQLKDDADNNNSRRQHFDRQRRNKLIGRLHRLPTLCGSTLHNCEDQVTKIANEIVAEDTRNMFVLGKGFAEAIAYEGALKLKEITYIHAEGYSGGALKHGPFALIEDGTVVIMLILDDEHSKVMVTNAHEIEARGGKMVYITDDVSLLDGLQQTRVIQIPSNGCLTALLSVLPLQLLAYKIAVGKGINPDKPKNLAKAVTVV